MKPSTVSNLTLGFALFVGTFSLVRMLVDSAHVNQPRKEDVPDASVPASTPVDSAACKKAINVYEFEWTHAVIAHTPEDPALLQNVKTLCGRTVTPPFVMLGNVMVVGSEGAQPRCKCDCSCGCPEKKMLKIQPGLGYACRHRDGSITYGKTCSESSTALITTNKENEHGNR